MSIPALHTGDGHDAEPAALRAPVRYGVWIQYGIVLFFVSALAWMALFTIDELVRGEGKIVPNGEVRTVQHLEGGVVDRILVRSGERVEEGQPMLLMDRDRASSDQKEVQVEFARTVMEINRREALLGNAELKDEFRLSGVEQKDLVSNRAAYRAEKKRFDSQIQALESDLLELKSERAGVESSLVFARRELALSEARLQEAQALRDSGALSDYEVSNEEREVLSASREVRRGESRMEELEYTMQAVRSRITEARNKFEGEQWARLAELYGQKDALSGRLRVVDGSVRRSTITAPVSGYVKQVFVNTRQAVVQPGAPIFEIVPTGENLVLEGRVSPKDIGFVREGMSVVVKISAYDFTIYGGLDGVVEQVSPDTIVEEDQIYYKVRVLVRNGYDSNTVMQLKPGMMASIDIVTGQRTILSFIMKPILRGLRSSLGEA